MGILDVLFGKSSSKTRIPRYIEDASKANIGLANEIARIGYVPYYGPEVAAMTPMQDAAMGNINDMASAFGMQTAASGMPEAQTFAGGIRGYASQPMFQEALDAFRVANPDQYAAIRAIFEQTLAGNPATPTNPANPAAPQQPAPYNPSPALSRLGGGGETAGMGGWGTQGGGGETAGTGGGWGGWGGYGGLRDMLDGGGPGASGPRFEGGGLLSGAGNLARDLRGIL